MKTQTKTDGKTSLTEKQQELIKQIKARLDMLEDGDLLNHPSLITIWQELAIIENKEVE